jgi:N-acetylglutamate synthase/N-acetylornithine aminotransferase
MYFNKLAAPAMATVLGFLYSDVAVAQGAWTQCVAWQNGEQWNIVGPHFNRDVCFRRARECTGNPNVQATYYSSLVIIQAPYRQCQVP